MTVERKQEENWHIVGVIPEAIAKQIGLGEKTPVWISDKIAGHIADSHGKELSQLRTTAIAFVHRVISGFNSVRRQKDGTMVLAIEGTNTAMVTYIKLELANDNYWRVKSAHIRPTGQLANITLLWQKKQSKKPAIK